MANRRLILVTGASRGLGRAMTAGFVERGHTVIGCSRSADAVRRLRSDFPPPNRFDEVDVADDLGVDSWAKSVLTETGAPELIINNAALINANNPLWEVPASEFSQVVDVNLKGVYHVIRHFVPSMIARGSGVIVNVSSGWGRLTAPDVAPYCATKWAVEGLTRALADELPPGMAAVPLNPGIIHTEMLDSCFAGSARTYPTPKEWATRAVPFILEIGPSDNGHPLSVPGG